MPSFSPRIDTGVSCSTDLLRSRYLAKASTPPSLEQLGDLLFGPAVVGEDDAYAGVQEGEFAQPVFERREVELGLV